MAISSIALTTFQETVRSAVARYPEQAERIKRAALIVAMDQVQRVTDEAYAVISQTDPSLVYTIQAGTYREPARGCGCVDAQRHPGQSCKHSWAIDLVQVAEERQRRIDARDQFPLLTVAEMGRLTAWKKRYAAESEVAR